MYVPHDPSEMVMLKEVLAQTMPSSFMSTFDIEKAHHNIRLHPDSYELVGFAVCEDGQVQAFLQQQQHSLQKLRQDGAQGGRL